MLDPAIKCAAKQKCSIATQSGPPPPRAQSAGPDVNRWRVSVTELHRVNPSVSSQSSIGCPLHLCDWWLAQPLPMQSCRKERSLMFCRGVKAGSQPPSETPAFSATLWPYHRKLEEHKLDSDPGAWKSSGEQIQNLLVGCEEWNSTDYKTFGLVSKKRSHLK